ncbi:MAG: TOBE domain-containing protein [Tabrizicola sp.]|nr:TOBE domain-containing protein [Tabrizicola sp.]
MVIIGAVVNVQQLISSCHIAVCAGQLVLRLCFIGQVQGQPGAELRIRIAAQDIILARDRPSGLSALNILPATVIAVREGEGPGALVQLDLAGQRILARITRRSARSLGLAPGLAVHVIIKSVAVARGDIGGIGPFAELS